MQLELPREVQRHIMVQLMSGNDVEIRLADGEFRVISLRKKCEKFRITDRMYNGKIQEMNEADALFNNPQNDYTKKLIAAICKV